MAEFVTPHSIALQEPSIIRQPSEPPLGILFDLGDTLFKISYDLHAGIQRLLELIEGREDLTVEDSRRIGNVLARSSEAVRFGSNYEVSFEAFHRNWCDRVGVVNKLSWPEMDLEYFKRSHGFALEEGVREVLETLQAAGIKMGVVSNSFHIGSSLNWMVEQGGIEGYFDFILSSADYGFRKPHPEFFETALARLEVPREHVWFVGDKPELDVVGARGVEITAVWYNADGEPPCAPEPDLTVGSWAEFRHVISKLQ